MNEMSPAPMGHNLPPLADLLVEETEALKDRAAELAAAVGRAHVSDDDTAGKAVMLAKMITTHRADIDKARVVRKEPFLEGGRTVDAHFKGIDGLLAQVDGKGKVIGGPLAALLKMLDDYRAKKEAEAAAERRRLQDEARKQQEAAEEAERARQEALQAGNAQAAMDAEVKALQAQAATETLATQAAATQAQTIDSGVGAKAFGRKTYRAEITDLKAALKHAISVDKAAIEAAVQGVYDRQVRAGVRELPGAIVRETTTTSIR